MSANIRAQNVDRGKKPTMAKRSPLSSQTMCDTTVTFASLLCSVTLDFSDRHGRRDQDVSHGARQLQLKPVWRFTPRNLYGDWSFQRLVQREEAEEHPLIPDIGKSAEERYEHCLDGVKLR